MTVAVARVAETTTIRVSVSARDSLQSLAREKRQSVGEVVDALLELHRREKFWEEMRVALERTRADPEAWEDYHREARLWEDATIADGLPDDEDWGFDWAQDE